MDIGFIFFGIPLRIGEVVFFLSILRIINSKEAVTVKKVNKIGLLILIFMLFNFLLVIGSNLFNNLFTLFTFKYLLRNFIYFFLLFSFLIKPIEYSLIKVNSFIKYIIYLVFVFFVIELVDFYIISFNWDNLFFVKRQGKSIFKDFIIKFSGQASEPAYIVPLLSISLMYGLFKKKFNYSIISAFFILMTFSSFGYAVILFAIFFFFMKVEDNRIRKKVENFLIKMFSIFTIIGLIFFNKTIDVLEHNLIKFQAFFGFGNAVEWSANQRTGHSMLALKLFSDSKWYQMIFGSGTGYYDIMSKQFKGYYLDDAEEAHNLYLSTLLDRGIIGLLFIISIFYLISKIRIPNTENNDFEYFFMALKFGVYVRIFHWIFTGMFWQYYFWVEIVLLLSAKTYFLNKKHEIR